VFLEYWKHYGMDDDPEEQTVIAPNFQQTVRPAKGEDQGKGGVVTLPKRKSYITPEMRENQRRAAANGRDG